MVKYLGMSKLDKLQTLSKQDFDVARLEFWAELADTKAVAVLKANMELGVGDQPLKAAIEVLNRAIGKPTEHHELTGANGGPVKVEGFTFVKNKK